MCKDRRAGAEAGLTLSEMMVSLLLAAILSAGLFYLTSGTQRSHDSQVDTVVLQESLWSAMEYVARQVRAAGRGFGGCARGEIISGPEDPTFRGLRVYNNCELTTDAPSGCPRGTDASDSLSITLRDEGRGLPTQLVQAPSRIDRLEIRRPEGFVPGELLFVWPFGKPMADCYLRRVVGTSGPDARGRYHLATRHPRGRAVPLFTVDPGALVVSLGALAPPSTMIPRYFAIDRSKGYPRLVTWQSGNQTTPNDRFLAGRFEVVVDGVEDLQIAWACDENGDGTLAEGRDAMSRRKDEWAFNTPADTLPQCRWRTPAALRITLIGRTRSARPRDQRGFRGAAEDRAAGTAAQDRALSGTPGTYRRRALTMTIRPENLRQAAAAP